MRLTLGRLGPVIALTLLDVDLASAAPPREPESASAAASQLAREHAPRRGSEIRFHGWSPESSFVAYTRVRHSRARRPGPAEVKRLHRRVRDGRFDGFGSMVGGDVEAHARRRGYVVIALPQRRLSDTLVELVDGERSFRLELDVGRDHGWRLREGDALIAEHRFDRIYVGFEAELFVSPDRSQGLLVMHLDTGWEVDAAAYPVDIWVPPTRGEPAETAPR